MKIKNHHIYAFFLIWFISIQGVSQSTKQFIKYGDQLYSQGNYYGAAIYYNKALNNDSSSIDLLYKYANSLKNYNNYEKAAYYFKKITEKDKAGRLYKDASLWLATMQKYNQQYKEALKSWKKVKSIYKSDKKSYPYLKAKKEINSCVFAMRTSNDSSSIYKVKNYGNTINTSASEFNGQLHNKNLEFSSLRADSINTELEIFQPNYKVGIYSAKSDSSWNSPTLIDTTVNNKKYHNANGSYSTNRAFYIFSRCDSINGCKLYYAKIINGKKSKPVALPDKINQKGANTTHPSLSMVNNKQVLFFSSDRKPSQGGLDIWYAEVFDGPTFGKPINAGKSINTPDPEITPFFNSKTNTLYFSSSWHNGYGGFDVFKSTFKNQKFSSPENLLSPINTSWNDMYFNINENLQKGVLTSNRKGIIFEKGPTCCNDLWEVSFSNVTPTEKIVIKTLDDLNKYLPVTLYFHNDRPGPKSRDTAVFINYLESYTNYKSMQQTYREEYAKGLSEEKENEAKLDIDDFFKHYVDKGVDDLKLFTELLLNELKKEEKIELTIKGFASPLAKSDYNVNLTKRRISSLINYLMQYDNNQFKSYIAEGKLIFNTIPFGEYTSKNSVSDDYYDQRNSIYNRSAALERRIEIQTIRKANYSDENYAELTVELSTHDFGKLTKGEVVTHQFTITNTGKQDLTIKSVESSCGCTVPSYNLNPLKPGNSRNITVEFDTSQLSGKQVKSITIISNAFPTTKRLVITAEIFDEK